MVMNHPNILWICTDQQRFDTLGCYGNKFVHTPNLDRLAEQGVLFEYCYSQSPVCTPSRASFLTGRYPRTTRCRQNGQSIPADEVLITRSLADVGYTCGLAGKLHLSVCEPPACSTTERRINDGYAEFHWSHHHSPDWGCNEYTNWLTEKGVIYRSTQSSHSEFVQVGMPKEYHQTTWCAEKAINFMKTNATFDQPWLFSVNAYDPHHPFDPPADYLERYLDRLDKIPLPNYQPGELDHKPRFQRIDHKEAYNGFYPPPGDYSFAKMSQRDHRFLRAAYWAMVDLIDEQVGHMLQVLTEIGQLNNTIIIFTSDHGEMLGDHGIYLKGPYFYEPAVRVPLIISWPKMIKPGRRSRALVELVDLVPTLLDALELQRPPGLQGQSFWSLLSDEGDLHYHREDIYSEYYNAMPWHRDPTAQATMVRTNRYKLVVIHGLGEGELYDLIKDPQETSNRWNDPAYQPVKIEMLQRLCDRMAWTVDPLPVREGRW